MADLKALAESLVNLTIKEANELAGILENDYGIKPAAAAVAVAAGPAAEVAAVEEQTEFNVILTGVADGKKIGVIKEVRAVTGLGLGEAKAVAETFPSVIKEGVSKEEAEALKKQFEEAGAVIELK